MPDKLEVMPDKPEHGFPLTSGDAVHSIGAGNPNTPAEGASIAWNKPPTTSKNEQEEP